MKKGEVIETEYGVSIIERMVDGGVWVRFASDIEIDDWTGLYIRSNTVTHRCVWLRKHELYREKKGASNRIKYYWYSAISIIKEIEVDDIPFLFLIGLLVFMIGTLLYMLYETLLG